MLTKSRHSRSRAPPSDDTDFLKSFAIRNVSANISLEEQEEAANALVREALQQSKQYQAEHNYKLPDHLEQFRLEYERAAEKSKVVIPIVSQLSPRTKREASLLPTPTFYEEQKIKKLVELSKKTDTSTLYNGLIPKHKAEEAPRFSAIANAKMVLIPHNVHKEVQKNSTHYFETMEHAVKRKQEQDEKMARLFDKYNDEPNKATHKPSIATVSGQSNRRQSVVPKLAPMANSTTNAPISTNAPFTPADGPQSPQRSPKRSAMGRAGVMNLSRSFSALGAVPSSASRPGTADYAPLTQNAIDPNYDEKLEPSVTPLLYSMFQNNPLAEKNVHYSTQEMSALLERKFVAENERLQRITAKLQQKSETEYLNLFSAKVLDETGLDLNKEYNKIRNYTIYLMQLSYHFYVQRMRAGFMQFHAQFAKIRAARIQRASEVVFRAVKLGVYLLTKTEKSRRANAQFEAEAQRLRELEALHRAKVKIIHRAMFLYTKMRHIRHLLRRRRAATSIQRRARGVIGRRVALEWKILHAFLSRHALVIQCAYRCRLARRKVTLTRKLRFVRLWLEHLQSLKAQRIRDMTENGAEIYIAKAYRTLVFRKKLKNLLYWHRYRCAMLIQRMFKGYRVRKKYHQTWALHKAKMVIHNRRALQLQMFVRCALARRRLYKLAFKKRQLDQERHRRKLLLLATSSSFNVKWMFVKMYRKMKFFRIDLLHKKATVIQKIWRGRHGRKRAFIVRIMRAIDAINVRFRRRIKCAAVIQRNWRGFITRLNLLRKRKQRMSLKIQTLWRLVRAKRRVAKLKKDHINARILTRKLCRLIKKHRFHIKYIWQQQRASFAVRIQALMRRALANMRICRMLSTKRAAEETRMFIHTRLNQLLAATQLQIIRDTMVAAMGHKTHAFSGLTCVCLGPVQALFTLAACSKGRTDVNTLFTNKADSITLIRYLHKVQGVLEGTDKKPKTKKSKKFPIATKLSLFQEYDAGRILLPEVQRKLKANQVDILFNRAKTEQGNMLSYADFLECLKLVAEAHYAKKDLNEAAADQDTPAMMASQSTQESAAPRPGSPPSEHGALHVSQAHRERMHSSVQQFKHAGQRRVHHLPRAKLQCSHHELFFGAEPDYRLALLLNSFASLRHEEWMTQILEWLEAESFGRVGLFVTRIQSVMRRHLAKKIVAVKHARRETQRLELRLFEQVAKVQSLVRMFLHRFRVARKAQRMLVQYCPHFGEPYWYNPHTKVKSWTKPKVLRYLNAYSLALPEEGLENVVNCSYCNKPAEVNCSDCEDSFCRVCYDSMHCKGARLKHRPMKIPHCSYCKFQVATKSCLTCIITEAPRGTMRESVHEAVRGHYCDTCFIHEHDSAEKALNLHKQRRKDLKNILAYSSQAYLVNQYLHQRIITSHHYEDMVQSCEECSTRSSTWRCQDCNQVYCSSCLIGLHSMGGPFARHKAELLPYFTPEMHISFKKDINKQLFRHKMEKLNKIEKARRVAHQFKCAIKIQAWWRMHLYGARGRKEMKRRRRRQRIAYRAYKRDTIQFRDTPSYKFSAMFGRAPELPTDNREDTALRKLNIFKKYQAREFINENREDWGYFRISRTKPQKGIPKTGFAWGTPEELLDQATQGGYRMPGRVMVVPGEQVLNTTCNLTRILHPGERVRIRNRIFGVVNVTATSVRVNRFWRAGDDLAKPSEEGELMYRVPTYKGEPRRAEYSRRYLAYLVTVENPVTQVGVAIYRWYSARMLRFALYMVRANKRNGLREEEQAWRSASVRFADAVRRADSMMASGDHMISLAGKERVPWQPRPLEEDALSLGLKKHRPKGLMDQFDRADDFDEVSALLDEDHSDSEDSWGEDGEVRPKSASQLRRGSFKSNKVVPIDESSSKSDSMGFDPSVRLEGSVADGASIEGGSVTSSKVGSLLSIVSNKIFNKEEALAVKAAADALYQQEMEEKGDQPKAAADFETIQAQRKEKKGKKKKYEKPEHPWYATADQLDARAEREDKMSLLELSLEADDWKECIDIMTENTYYQNIKTNELFSTVPRAVAAKRQLEFENSKNKKNYDEAQKRIQKLEDMIKNRKLITGGHKK